MRVVPSTPYSLQGSRELSESNASESITRHSRCPTARAVPRVPCACADACACAASTRYRSRRYDPADVPRNVFDVRAFHSLIRGIAESRSADGIEVGRVTRLFRYHEARLTRKKFYFTFCLLVPQRTRPNSYEDSLVFPQFSADRPKRVRIQPAGRPKNSAWVER